jgi:hypothetical protein
MGVAENYNNLTANFCLPVASTLALHPSFHEWTKCLTWTMEPNKAGWAIADGVLQLTPSPDDTEVEDVETYESILEHFDPDIRKDLGELRRSYRDLAVWEMKSLTVGDFKVMNSILELATKKSPFIWKRCRGSCGRSEHEQIHASPDALPHGFDALHPPWTLPLDEPVESHPSLRQSQRLSVDFHASGVAGPSGTGKSLKADSSLASLSSLNSEEAHELGISEGRRGRKRKHDGRRSWTRSPTKKRGSGASYQGRDGPREEVNGQAFLQQVSNTR